MKSPGPLSTFKSLDSYNPATQVRLGSIAVTSAAAIDAAVRRSRAAAADWAATPLSQRIALLETALHRLKDHASELAAAITAEMGKPIHEAHREVEDGFESIRWYLAQAPSELEPRLDRSDAHEVHELCYLPQGVTSVIVPWNFPFLNVVWPLFPNLLVGNTVILKHSEKTPLFAERLRELIQPELPRGVFELITGDRDTGRLLVQADVDQICFTGSTTAGLEIQRSVLDRAAKRGRAIPVHTELGGSAPGIVLEDADIASTSEAIFRARFENAGQVCDGLKRLLVDHRIHDRLVDALSRLLAERRFGDPAIPATFIGPLVDAAQKSKVESQVADARARGGFLRTFGDSPEGSCFVAPTLIVGADRRMRVWQEEVFGPVLPIVAFHGLEQAIELANDTVYGLGGYVYSADLEQIRKLRRRLNTGMVGVAGSYYVRPFIPFTSGGYGLSGTGSYNGPGVFGKLCRTQITSYPRMIFSRPEGEDAVHSPANQPASKKARAQETLVEHGVWQVHADGVVEISQYELPIRLGEEVHDFRISLWAFNEGTPKEDTYYIASYGQARFGDGAPLVRLQSLCPHGHYFHSTHCDCDEQRDLALRLIVEDPIGGILVMAAGEKHAGRGIGQVMIAGLYSYGYLTGRDVVTEAFNDLHFNRDERDFTAALEVLRRMNLKRIRLLTNNPDKVRQVGQAQGLEIEKVVPVIGRINARSLKERLLLARAGHHYDREELDQATSAAIARDGFHPLTRW
jgi:acyl-CoA reductase-like NAD-dependent aldehyde dehydrogenase/GTP cyclohydrolase II